MGPGAIIIDDVDVSECEYLYDDDNLCKLGKEDFVCGQFCKGDNCYYKQLKRKEQECEKFKQALKEIREITFEPRIFGFWDEQLDRIKKKCEVIKE